MGSVTLPATHTRGTVVRPIRSAGTARATTVPIISMSVIPTSSPVRSADRGWTTLATTTASAGTTASATATPTTRTPSATNRCAGPATRGPLAAAPPPPRAHGGPVDGGPPVGCALGPPPPQQLGRRDSVVSEER